MSQVFETVSESISFSEEERKVEALWAKTNAFETSYKRSEGKPEFTFYDGPPFATGLPHYGHILAGTIKDIVTRYAHQTGHRVTRRFGWDCHGLPVEYEIDKKLGIRTKEDVAAMGIARYNAECRSIVARYTKEWEIVVTRMGRWIDFKNDYRTMDTPYMESVWWVFSQLFTKGLVYKGFKVMPYSTACTTPLSNFEAGQNYKMVDDPAIVVSFPVLPNKEYSFLAWTTTPWTLPSNLGLCVNPDFDYVQVKDKATQEVYVLAKCRLAFLYPLKGSAPSAAPSTSDQKVTEGEEPEEKVEVLGEPDTSKYEILREMKGSTLVGQKYEPLFDYFASQKGAFVVMADNYVTKDSGVGIVHQAPAFGEDDYRVCLAHAVIQRGQDLVCPVDDNGNFMDSVRDFKGRNVKSADRDIIRALRTAKRLVRDGTSRHSYPHCWRSDTPLIYKAVPSWFVNVPAIKERLLANNLKSYWVPAFVQEKRFANWLADAMDWSVSRNRYWGTPLPIWASEDYKELVCIGSIEELKRLSGNNDITDLHRDKIDHITIPSKQGKGVLKRVDEVFDCWFESGSMPYAQQHYPFENKELFEKNFPADFIAEGLDQTRGWFYTLMVISTALFDKPPFKNLVVNGLVLAADGKKMSKRLKNYTDPTVIVDMHGADALRLYLINSPVVRAEPLRFVDMGVQNVAKDIFIPWFNVYRFFVTQARRVQKLTGKPFVPQPDIHVKATNIMDKWILSALQTLIKEVRGEMKKYFLYTVIPHLLKFLEFLSKWYVRFNKSRLKGDEGLTEAQDGLATLFKVLFEVCRLMGPFTPFLVEHLYQNLKRALPRNQQEDSVHYLYLPDVQEDAIDQQIERRVSNMQTVIEMGRSARDRVPFSSRYPVRKVTIIDTSQEMLDDVESLSSYVKTQLNCKELVLSSKVGDYVQMVATPDKRALGKRLGDKLGKVLAAFQTLSSQQVTQLQERGVLTVCGDIDVQLSEVLITTKFAGDDTSLQVQAKGNTLLMMDKLLTEDLIAEGEAREIMSKVQQLRKKAKLSPEDIINAWYECKDASLCRVLESQASFISKGIGLELSPYSRAPQGALVITTQEAEVFGPNKESYGLTLYLTKRT
jgi:isoleucyl-tRNA synthetase